MGRRSEEAALVVGKEIRGERELGLRQVGAVEEGLRFTGGGGYRVE